MFAPFCLDCLSLSLSSSHSQHIPSVLTQLGSIQLCCPRRERESERVCFTERMREERSFIFFSNFSVATSSHTTCFHPHSFFTLIFLHLLSSAHCAKFRLNSGSKHFLIESGQRTRGKLLSKPCKIFIFYQSECWHWSRFLSCTIISIFQQPSSTQKVYAETTCGLKTSHLCEGTRHPQRVSRVNRHKWLGKLSNMPSSNGIHG